MCALELQSGYARSYSAARRRRPAWRCAARSCCASNAGPDAVLRLEGGTLFVDGRPLALEAPLKGVGRYDPPTVPLDADGQGIPYAACGFAAQIAALSVDTELGTVHLSRIVAAHDVGRAINPTLVEARSMAASPRGSAWR